MCAAVGGDYSNTAGKRHTQLKTGPIGGFWCLLSREHLSVGRVNVSSHAVQLQDWLKCDAGSGSI